MTLHVVSSNATGSTQDLTALDTMRLPGLSVDQSGARSGVAGRRRRRWGSFLVHHHDLRPDLQDQRQRFGRLRDRGRIGLRHGLGGRNRGSV